MRAFARPCKQAGLGYDGVQAHLPVLVDDRRGWHVGVAEPAITPVNSEDALKRGRSNDHTCDARGLGQELQRWRTQCASWARARAHLLLPLQLNVHVVDTTR